MSDRATDQMLRQSKLEPAEGGGDRTLAAPAFFRMRDVLRITALSRPTLYRRIAAGRFPPPVHLGGRACAWTPTALQAWIDDPEGYRAAQISNTEVRRGPGRPRKYAPY